MNRGPRFASRLLLSGLDALAAGTVLRQRESAPGTVDLVHAPFGGLQADTAMRLRYLAAALWADRAGLLHDHLAWAKVALASRDVPDAFLLGNLACMKAEIEERLPETGAAPAAALLTAAADEVRAAPATLPSLLDGEAQDSDALRRWILAALEGRPRDALVILDEGLRAGRPIPELQALVLRALAEVGRMWQCNEIHVGEEHFVSMLAEDSLALLRRAIPEPPGDAPLALLACVEGDLHGLGARVAADRFACAGWHTHPLGASVPPEDLVRTVRDVGPDLVVLSAHLGIHVSAVGRAIDALRAAGAAPSAPVLVGGHPFRVVTDLWSVVGADAGAPDLDAAVAAARTLVRKR